MWMVYKFVPGAKLSPVDHEPNSYANIAFYATELEALRHANREGLKVAEIPRIPTGGYNMEWIRQENAKTTPAWRKSDNL